MRKIMFTSVSILIFLLLNGSTSASTEDMFSEIKPPEPNNGLVFEIALPKQEYFFFEPVTVYARFKNTTDRAMAIVLQSNGSSSIDSKLIWDSSSLDDKAHRPITYSSLFENMIIIPGKGTAYFALPDRMFPIGKTKIRIEYRHFQDYNQPSLAGINLWQGTINSNELMVVSLDKKNLTPEEMKQVNDKIRRNIELLSNGDNLRNLRAEAQLIALSRYAVPTLVENLRSKNSRLRAATVDTLGRIADKTLCDERGYERNVSFLDDLLAAYDKEKDFAIKERILNTLIFFKDVEAGELPRIVQTLKEATNEEDMNLRRTGALILLKVSKKDGIPLVINKMADQTYFGEGAYQQVLLNTLREETGQNFGRSSKDWQNWWEKNRDNFITNN